jgi:hypothetical protein
LAGNPPMAATHRTGRSPRDAYRHLGLNPNQLTDQPICDRKGTRDMRTGTWG